MRKILSVFTVIVLFVALFPVASFSKEYKTMTFGSFPQTKVSDADILSVLNADTSDWISYNYCYGENYIPVHGDYMKYKDVIYNNEKYRGVTFSAYRPNSSSDVFGSSAINSYYTNQNYWFKYEPIEWTVLDEKTGLIVTSKVIDAQCFAEDSAFFILDKIGYYSDSTCTYPANNYEVSSIRKYLNNNFYNLSFSENEKTNIKSSALDVSESIVISASSFSSENVFLLSKTEIENTSYFDPTADFTSECTDYALCQGLIIDESGNSKFCISRSGSGSFSIFSSCRDSAATTRDPWLISGIRPAVYVTNTSAACVHNYVLSSQENATCIKSGTKTFTCSKCSDAYTETVPATGHDEETVKGYPATCINTGLTDGKVCKKCKTVTVAQVEIPVSIYHSNQVVVDAVSPGCITCGYTAGVKCATCGYFLIQPEKIAPVGHKFVNYVDDNNATCISNGTKTAICENCTFTDSKIIPNSSLGHTGGTANCVDKAVCSRCKSEYGETNPDNHKSIVEDKAVPATCTSTGLTAGSHCESCKTVVIPQQTVEKKSHDYGSQIIAPDCITKGYTLYTCKNCPSSYTDNYTDALGHTGGTANCVDKAVCSRCKSEYGETNPANHKSIVEDKAVPATCTSTGLTAGSHCESCKTVVIPQQTVEKISHDYGSQIIAPDCITKGYTRYICKNCPSSYTDNYTDALGHTGGTANCVDKAVCSRCKSEYGETNPANHKSIVEDKAVPATCTSTGLTAGSHCESCKTVVIPQQTVEKKSHDYGSQIIAPYCITKGYTLYTCKNCPSSYTDNYTDALGHTGGTANCVDKAVCSRCKSEYGETNPDNHKSIVEDKAVPATCTSTGLTAGSHCESCKTVVIPQQTVEKISHDFASQTISPDCLTKGYTLYTCKNCPSSYTDNYTDALGHTGGTANCVDNAVCSRCKSEYGETNPDNHKSIVEDKAVPATCTSTGLTTGTHCISCKKILTEQKTVAIINHNYSFKIISPDCTHQGYTLYRCSVCGYEYKDSIIPATNHKDSDCNGICDVCGANSKTDTQLNCSHICHKNGFRGFMWKIINAFNKLFKIKQYCECGLRHW